VVRVYKDFLLRLVQNHRDFAVFNVDDLPGITLVLCLGDSDEISRFEVLADHRNVDLQRLGQLRNSNGLEGHLSGFFDCDHRAFEARQVTLVDRNLVTLGVQ